ncbi:LCP family protein [Melissospora conviva]|uniref:LCP family protein n=1 Tax=Melissospora conviva TaxID=3388432 RepID=UPI003C16EB73
MSVQTRPSSRTSTAAAARVSQQPRSASKRSGPPGPPAGGKRKKSKGGKDPMWARLLLIFGAVLMVVSGASIVGAKTVINQATKDIKTGSLVGDAGKSSAEGGDDLKGPIDLLLLGVDVRADWDASDVRADTIIVLHIPATHDAAYLISIPRDTKADIPGHGTDKINSAFHFGAQNGGGWEGGAQLMAKTIKGLTGVSFDGAAIINFGGFRSIVNALDGIKVCVKQPITSAHMMRVEGEGVMALAKARESGKPYQPVSYKKGCQKMNGWQALDFSRQRKGMENSDYGRQQNQQQVIKAIAKKATESGVVSNPMKVQALLKAAGESLVLDTGNIAIEDFVYGLRGVGGGEMTMLRTNGGNFNGDGITFEFLDETTMGMFQAIKSDTLAEYVYNNPSVLSDRK